MTKLPKTVKKRVKKASAEGREPLPTGIYPVKIAEIQTDGEGDAGPYWTWVFEVLGEGDGREHKGRRLFYRTSFAEGVEFRIKQILEALDEDEDADTDDLEGEKVRVAVRETTIASGSRKGEPSNDIDRVMPYDEDEDEDELEGDEDEEEEEPEEEEEEPPKKKAKSKSKSKPKSKKKSKKKADEDEEEFEFAVATRRWWQQPVPAFA